jgi:hypothetical protein
MRGLAANRALWAVVAAILALGPAVFTLLRASHFEASTGMTPVAVGSFPKVPDPAFYRPLLADPMLRFEIRRTTGLELDPEDITIAPMLRSERLQLTAEGETPREANALANGVAHQLSQSTRRQLAAEVQRDLSTLRPLASARGSGPLRRRLDRRIERLEALGPLPPARIAPDRPGRAPEPPRWADRVVDALPGEFPGRPSPFWAAVAGLMVAATLWGIVFVLGGRRERR